MDIKEILKTLKINKKYYTIWNTYYIIGYENQMQNIKERLLNSDLVKNVETEFFTTGFGRILFEINN